MNNENKAAGVRRLSLAWRLAIAVAIASLSIPASAQIAIGIGAGFADEGAAVAIDLAGNTYLTGKFGQTVDFDPGPGVLNLTSLSGFSNFVASYDTTGTPNWAFALPGGGQVPERGIAVDNTGTIFVTGFFSGIVDFDPGTGEEILNSTGGNLFVASYEANGDFRFAFNIGGDEPSVLEVGTAIAVAPSGNLYLTGLFPGTADFDPTDGEILLESNGVTDAFVASYTRDGGLRYAIGVGGTGSDRGLGVAVDSVGNSYVTGSFRGTADFDPDVGELLLTSSGNRDIFVASYNDSGALRYALGAGGPGEDIGRAIAIDASGNAFVTGGFHDTVDFDPGAGLLNLVAISNEDTFLASYTSGGSLRFAFGTGGMNNDGGYGLALDGSGDVYMTGEFVTTADFDPGAGVHELVALGANDAFVARYSNTGSFRDAYSFSTTTSSVIVGRGIALDGAGRPGIVGTFTNTVDFDPGSGEMLFSSGGSSDIFFSSFTPDATDTDGDGVGDPLDNCVLVANAGQVDTNGDSIGNVCDPDIGSPSGVGLDDCIVNFADLNFIKNAFFASAGNPDFNPDADLTGPGGTPDGSVNFGDLNVMKAYFFAAPGPSAAGCN